MRLRRLVVAAALVAMVLPSPTLAQEPVTLTVMNWGNQGDAWWAQRFADYTALNGLPQSGWALTMTPAIGLPPEVMVPVMRPVFAVSTTSMTR